jgi:hypothetical protein
VNRSRHSWQYEERCFLSSVLIRGGSSRKCVMILTQMPSLIETPTMRQKLFHPPFFTRYRP